MGSIPRNLQVSHQAGKVGMVFQDFETQLVSTNVEMELRYPLEYIDPPLSVSETKQRIQWALGEVGLAGLESRDPFSLSGGQRQRLVFASLLVRRPGLFVLDQSMSDLDPEARVQFRDLIDKMRKAGTSFLFSAHESEEVLSADKVCVLHHGQVAWEGRPDTLFRQPDLAKQYGIRPNIFADCFTDLRLPILPVTVEEAWKVAEEFGLTLDPPPSLYRDDPVGRVQGESTQVQHSPVLKVENVSFCYEGGAKALKDISLSIGSGEFVAVVGKKWVW